MPIKLIESTDTGIYDAMNQALAHISGEYVYFLNCGDYLYSNDVLSTMLKETEDFASEDKYILYGNIKNRFVQSHISSDPSINGFSLYRNVPCHQACIYDSRLVSEHQFDTSFKVRADYEQFLWCYYVGKASLKYVDICVADYEGGGYSAQNEEISKEEHEIITHKYMTDKEIAKYKAYLALTLSKLRTKVAESPKMSVAYNQVKKLIYKVVRNKK